MRKQALSTIHSKAVSNSKILFIGSDLGVGVLEEMKKNLPNQFLMEGVSEQYLIGFAAGLALEGFRPFINTIGSFLTKRCYEQIYIDLCLHNLPVTLVANGGGAVYAPLGPTHLNFDDFSILKTLPNLKIFAPADAVEMDRIIRGSLKIKSPIYIRVGRGGEKIVTNNISKKLNILKCSKLVESREHNIITTGSMLQTALDISNQFKKQGKRIGVVHVPCIKPIDESELLNIISKSKKIFIIEEHYINGGLGSSILDFLTKKSKSDLKKLYLYGIDNKFYQKYGSQKELLKYFGLDSKSLFNKIKKCF